MAPRLRAYRCRGASRRMWIPGRTTRKLRAESGWGRPSWGFPLILARPMAKDTEKLIRQLSLISFLMAERRPVTALEIKQDVEGYSQMNDKELGALRTSLSLLDGEFAYAEPLRLALQQLSWGKPSPLDAPEQRSVALAVTAGAGGRELSQRLSKGETAIFRRKTIVFDYYPNGRDAEEKRKVDPYHLLYRGGQFYLIGHSHERGADRVFRISRIRGKVGY